jgi:hypothetical protein
MSEVHCQRNTTLKLIHKPAYMTCTQGRNTSGCLPAPLICLFGCTGEGVQRHQPAACKGARLLRQALLNMDQPRWHRHQGRLLPLGRSVRHEHHHLRLLPTRRELLSTGICCSRERTCQVAGNPEPTCCPAGQTCRDGACIGGSGPCNSPNVLCKAWPLRSAAHRRSACLCCQGPTALTLTRDAHR